MPILPFDMFDVSSENKYRDEREVLSSLLKEYFLLKATDEMTRDIASSFFGPKKLTRDEKRAKEEKERLIRALNLINKGKDVII